MLIKHAKNIMWLTSLQNLSMSGVGYVCAPLA